MEPRTIDQDIAAQIEAKRRLQPNFAALGNWIFMNIDNGLKYDLSAADLDHIDRIVEKGSFLVE